jgi:uncharacterized membrane protein YsdA (DUF1294 family)
MVRRAELFPDGSRSTGRRRRSVRKFSTGSIVVVLAFLALFAVVAVVWAPPSWLPALYLIASVVCFLVYAADKSAARNHGWRVPESALIVIGLLGGWPGAIVAQQTLRHKTLKRSFRAAFWLSVVVNIGVFIFMCSPQGTGQLLQLMR